MTIDPEEIEIRKLLGMSLQLTPDSHAMRHCICAKCEDARKVVALIRAAVAEERERCVKLINARADSFYRHGEREGSNDMGALYRELGSTYRDAARLLEDTDEPRETT